MSLFPIVDGRARFDASGNVDTDRYSAGIRFTQEGAARSTTAAGTFFNQGIPMSATGQVSLVDASAGLPAGTIYHNGLPMNGDRVCISNKPVAVVSSGIPYDTAGAVAATVAPITNLPTLDLVFAGTATDPLDVASTTDDTLSLNFTAEAYQIAAQYAVWGTGGLQAVNFADIVTFTRASTATYFNSAGTLTTATTNEARFDYDPATLLARGFLIEEQRTNSIRNNTMQGAVAGTPGTLPTNWALGGISGGLATQVVGTGTENGITYIDIRIFGTNSSGSSVFPGVFFDTTTGIAGTTGQVWSESLYLSLAAGTGISFELAVHEADSGGVFLRSTTLAGTSGVPTTGALNTRRRAGSVTLGASTAFVRPVVATTVTNGTSVDFTLRIGLPQLELGAFATSVIPTTTTALTRSADVASVNTLSPWFNSVSGTIFAEFLRNTTPAASTFPQFVNIDDGSTSNRLALSTNSSRNLRGQVAIAGVFTTIATANAYTEGAVSKLALGYQALNHAAVANGGTAATDTSVNVPSGLTTMRLGAQSGGAGNANGWLRRITYYPRRLPNADLQTITA